MHKHLLTHLHVCWLMCTQVQKLRAQVHSQKETIDSLEDQIKELESKKADLEKERISHGCVCVNVCVYVCTLDQKPFEGKYINTSTCIHAWKPTRVS